MTRRTDRYERKHRRTHRHPEVVAQMANANFDTRMSLSAAMGFLRCVHGGTFPCPLCGACKGERNDAEWEADFATPEEAKE